MILLHTTLVALIPENGSWNELRDGQTYAGN
jgi:hypothetical protein